MSDRSAHWAHQLLLACWLLVALAGTLLSAGPSWAQEAGAAAPPAAAAAKPAPPPTPACAAAVAETDKYAAVDDWQYDTVHRSRVRNRPCRGRSAGGSDVDLLAKRRALIERPVVPAAGQRLRGIVMLEDRGIGNED